MTYVEYYRSVAIWSIGDGEACRLRWTDSRLRQESLRRYGTARFLIQDFQLLLVLCFLVVNLGALVGPWFALPTIAVDIGVLAGVYASSRRRHRSIREELYELQGFFYGPFRQLLFAIGFLRRLPPADAYPHDVEIISAGPVEGSLPGL